MKISVSHLTSLALLVVGCAAGPTDSDDGFRRGNKGDDPWGWSHAVLGTSDGLGISIDYVSNYRPDTTSYKPTNVDHADPVYANVWADSLTGDEAVRVVVMNYERCERYSVPYTYTLDLEWQGDHFSGNVGQDAQITRSYLTYAPGTLELTTRWSGYGGNHPWCQDVAIVVDGVWQVDPIGGGNNFQIDMYAGR